MYLIRSDRIQAELLGNTQWRHSRRGNKRQESTRWHIDSGVSPCREQAMRARAEVRCPHAWNKSTGRKPEETDHRRVIWNERRQVKCCPRIEL